MYEVTKDILFAVQHSRVDLMTLNPQRKSHRKRSAGNSQQQT